MKRGFQKSLALLLAVFMTFGAVPFLSVGMIAFAANPELKNISLSVESEFTMKVGETKKIGVTATYSDYSSKPVAISKVGLTSSNSALVSIASDGTLKAEAITVKKDEKGQVVKDEAGNEVHEPVTITAYYDEGGEIKSASCSVTVIKAAVKVDKIMFNWETNALYAGTDKVYSFAYKTGDVKYTLIPDNPDVTSATLTCTPASALQIDNEKKTFKVNPLEDKETLSVTLTLTADGASASCQAATKTMTIYRDIPITGISWNFKNETRTPLFSYYEKNDKGEVTNKLAAYYFMPTELGDANSEYKFKILPASLKLEPILELCTVTYKSSDERVIVIEEETGRIIPVGNGSAELTISLETPKHKVVKDTVTAYVQNSPYTPVSSVAIGYDEKNTDVDAVKYDKDSDRLTLMFSKQIQLIPNMNAGAKLDVKPIDVELDNGETLQTVKKINYTWKSDDTSIATVDKNGLVVAGSGKGTATITLTIDDNGHKYEDTVKIRTQMPWWEVLIAILMSLFSGKWSKIPSYFGMLFN